MKKIFLVIALLALVASNVFAFAGIGELFKKEEIVNEQEVVEKSSKKNADVNPVSSIALDLAEKKSLNRAETKELKEEVAVAESKVQRIIDKIDWQVGAGLELGYTDSILFSPAVVFQASVGGAFVQIGASYDFFTAKQFGGLLNQFDTITWDGFVTEIKSWADPSWNKLHCSIIFGGRF